MRPSNFKELVKKAPQGMDKDALLSIADSILKAGKEEIKSCNNMIVNIQGFAKWYLIQKRGLQLLRMIDDEIHLLSNGQKSHHTHPWKLATVEEMYEMKRRITKLVYEDYEKWYNDREHKRVLAGKPPKAKRRSLKAPTPDTYQGTNRGENI